MKLYRVIIVSSLWALFFQVVEYSVDVRPTAVIHPTFRQ